MQVGGVSIMLLACIATMNEVARRPVLFAGYLRLSVIVLAMVSLIGVAQFVLANALGHPGIAGVQFSESMVGRQCLVQLRQCGWHGASEFDFAGAFGARDGARHRPPGVALIRLGLRGGASRRVANGSFRLDGDFDSRWIRSDVFTDRFFPAAGGWRIVVGGVANHQCERRCHVWRWRRSCRAVARYAAIASTLPELSEKLDATESITSDDIQVKRAEDLSAIALAVNLAVMRANLSRDPMLGAGLGAHPVTYDRENPGLGRLPADIVSVGMNKEDAASLLIRLLSESGILGTLAFIAGWMLAMTRSRRFILASISARRRARSYFCRLRSALRHRWFGVGVACLARAPQYYAPWFWLPMALTASVPELLSRIE